MEIHIKKGSLALVLKLLLPLAIVAAAVMLARFMLANPPTVERRAPPANQQLRVRTQPLQAEDYQLYVTAFAEVEAAQRTRLAAKVGGEVSYLAPELRSNGRFRQGQELLRLDSTDYELAIKSAEATLAQAEAALLEERARSEQARRDWQQAGRSGQPGDLTLRKPQLLAAEASLASASAQLERARLDLERTLIRAPFDGVVINKYVEVGEQLSAGAQLAEIHSSDAALLRLPVAQNSFAMIADYVGSPRSRVDLIDDIGNQLWRGKLVYVESSIDAETRQIVVVAEIPGAWQQPGAGPKLGQYLQARIQGKLLRDVFVLPRSVLRSDDQIFVLADGVLQLRQVDLLWVDDQHAVVDSGLRAGDLLVLDALGSVLPGSPARPMTTLSEDTPADSGGGRSGRL